LEDGGVKDGDAEANGDGWTGLDLDKETNMPSFSAQMSPAPAPQPPSRRDGRGARFSTPCRPHHRLLLHSRTPLALLSHGFEGGTATHHWQRPWIWGWRGEGGDGRGRERREKGKGMGGRGFNAD
jgi:hypothetical protein